MAETTILICDVCGRPAEESVTFRVGGRNLVKDFCPTHLRELTTGARAPRRGRKHGTTTTTAPKRRGRPKGSTSKRTGAKKTGPKRATSRGRKKASARKPANGRRKASNGRRKLARARKTTAPRRPREPSSS